MSRMDKYDIIVLVFCIIGIGGFMNLASSYQAEQAKEEDYLKHVARESARVNHNISNDFVYEMEHYNSDKVTFDYGEPGNFAVFQLNHLDPDLLYIFDMDLPEGTRATLQGEGAGRVAFGTSRQEELNWQNVGRYGNRNYPSVQTTNATHGNFFVIEDLEEARITIYLE